MQLYTTLPKYYIKYYNAVSQCNIITVRDTISFHRPDFTSISVGPFCAIQVDIQLYHLINLEEKYRSERAKKIKVEFSVRFQGQHRSSSLVSLVHHS